MDAVPDIDSALCKVFSKAQDVRDRADSYRSSKAVEDFAAKLKVFEYKYKFWKEHGTVFDLATDQFLISALPEADRLLESELSKLSRRVTKEDGIRLTKRPKFPRRLGTSIELLNQLLELKMWKDSQMGADLSRITFKRMSSLDFRKDDRYIPLTGTEAAVRKLLEDPDKRVPVVLLYGGPGRGKTTLARALALSYKESLKEISALAPSPHAFDDVIYLDCGREMDRLGKHMELQRYAGGNTFSLRVESSGESSTRAQEWPIIRKSLQILLKSRKSLIILDDLWSAEFLQSLVDVCGDYVKCLVTSQLGNLCNGLNCIWERISMEAINAENARSILAAHVGMEDNRVPLHMQEFADEIIRRVDMNPLAIACIATAIDRESFDEEDCKGMLDQLADLLANVPSRDLAHIHSRQYPRSIWEAMQGAFDNVTQHEKSLLILATLCYEPVGPEDRGIPEEVMKFLFRKVVNTGSPGFETFSKSKRELEARQLISGFSNPKTLKKSWSVHSPLRLYLDSTKRAEKKSMLAFEKSSEAGITSELQSETDVVIAVGILYFKNEYSEQLRSNLDVTGCESKDVPFRRYAMEPLTRALVLDVIPDRICCLSSARQVFLQYVFHGEVDQFGVTDLLESSKSCAPILDSLNRIISKEVHYFGERIVHAIVKVFKHVGFNSNEIFDSSGPDVIEGNCASVLTYIVRRIDDRPQALEGLFAVLKMDNDPERQMDAVRALANLAQGSVDVHRVTLICSE